MPYFILLDDAAQNTARLYQQHIRSRFFTAEQLNELDEHLTQGWHEGLHSIIFSDYEFSMPLVNLKTDIPGYLSVHWFKNCTPVSPLEWLSAQYAPEQPAGITTPANNTDKQEYLNAVKQIQDAIGRGDTYQINYTTRLYTESYGNPIKLYTRLRQPVPYGALAHLPNHEGHPTWTLCFSPELFLRINSDGLITTEPMKGTAPVLNDGKDKQRATLLQQDPKNRAENIMIVDLLRNDLGKIAETGQVRVPEPFKVNRFGSVWQMTTAIHAQARPDTSIADIFRAAFPCGSITGAPKRMSMQIIQNIEKEARRLYTGSIGYLAPCNSGLGFYGTLNVVIRTLQLKPSEPSTPCSDGQTYQGIYGVGSGIVADSIPEEEYTECQWKSRFLNNLSPEFSLFETMKVFDRRCEFLNNHIGRLKISALTLNMMWHEDYEQQIQRYIHDLPDTQTYRIKATLSFSDGLSLSHSRLTALPARNTVLLATDVLPKHDFLRRFKTTHRKIYDRGWQDAEKYQAFDSLFFNSDGHLLEGGRSNVFIRLKDQWLTPPLHLDILNGIMRQNLLNQPEKYLHSKQVSEALITASDLEKADEIILCNALRGILPVRLQIHS